MKTLFLHLTILIITGHVYAQADSVSDPDKAFETARNLAFSGKREDGRQLALRILEKYPNYSDVQTFVGRTYAWDKNYDAARKFFSSVASAEPSTLDNYYAWIDAETWADSIAVALRVIERALQYFPMETELQYRKAKLLYSSGDVDESIKIVQEVLRKDSKHAASRNFLRELRRGLSANSVSTGVTYDQFSNYFSPAYYAFLQTSRSTRPGSFIVRINYADRFGKKAFQPEIELYPTLSKNLYAYINVGLSNGELFARRRYGFEVFASLPHSFEASLGWRHLFFGPESSVNIYTGSLGFYSSNYWFSFRPYITPNSGRNSLSASLTTRKYLSTAEHYFSFVLRAGFSPELIKAQTLSGGAVKDFYNLKSQSVSVGYQQPVSNRWSLNGDFSFGRQQYSFSANEYVINTTSSLTVRYRYH